MNKAETREMMAEARKKPPLIARLGQKVITVVAGIVFMVSAFLWFWSGLMLSWYFIIVYMLLMLLCLWAWTQKAFAIKYMIFTAIGLLALLPAKGIGERQMQTRYDTMKAEIAATGVEGLDPFEKVLLWQTNLVLASSWAIAGDPWTAATMALMNLPSDGARTLPLFLKPAPGCPPYHEKSATSGHFNYPAHLEMHMRVPILDLHLQLDSSLLDVLEQAGWLHTYDVTWGE